MISLTRDRSAKAAKRFSGKTKKQFEKDLLIDERRRRRGEIKNRNFKSDRWREAKKQLLIETNGKCAYCEAPTSAVAYGDVEHYRPKSIYWWLAYSYDNYLASCVLCNQRFKKDQFPILNSPMPGPDIRKNTTDRYIKDKAGTIAPDPQKKEEIDDFISKHKQEGPLLLNPYFDCPERYFTWDPNDTLKEVDIVPNRENSDLKRIAEKSIKKYGLNRPELQTYRYVTYRHYRTYKQLLNSGLAFQKNWDDLLASIKKMKEEDSSPDIRESYDRFEQLVEGFIAHQRTQTNSIRDTIENMKEPDAPFAGMVRYFDTSDRVFW